MSSASTAARPSFASVWWHAARPNTLPAAVTGVVVGLGTVLSARAALRLDTALGCLAVGLLLQVLANFANDLSDFRRGADTAERQGPTRVTAAGWVTERQLETAIAAVIGLAGLVGLYLVWVGGPGLLAIGAAAVVAALAYTGGPLPYGYRAMGEVFVFLFFGLVAVAGTAYLQTLTLVPLYLVAAVPPGALVTAILVVNNLRDIPTDAAAGKRTLAVVLGRRRTAIEYTALLAVAYAVPVLLAGGAVLRPGPAGLGEPPALPLSLLPLAVLAPLLTLPLARPLVGAVHGFAEPRELNRVLKGTARLALWFGLLFAAGLAVSGVGAAGAPVP